MGIKKYNPTSPGQRFRTVLDSNALTADKPLKSLVQPLKKSGGRNNKGRITVWHRGGGNKRKYRIIDFKRDKAGVPAVIASIEYDPNRSANIALVHYKDGEKRYIIMPDGMKIGDEVLTGPDAEIKVGNAMTLNVIPLGTVIHNIELNPGQGGKLVRSAGSSAQVIAKDERYVQVKLASGEVRRLRRECMATIGQVSNPDHENIAHGKAGRSRWVGKRPTVRGVAMNPIDHPLGGGEGKSSGGRPPCSPWGKPEGTKTRRNKKTDRYIVRKRSKK